MAGKRKVRLQAPRSSARHVRSAGRVAPRRRWETPASPRRAGDQRSSKISRLLRLLLLTAALAAVHVRNHNGVLRQEKELSSQLVFEATRWRLSLSHLTPIDAASADGKRKSK
jgi:hypothetical protein